MYGTPDQALMSRAYSSDWSFVRTTMSTPGWFSSNGFTAHQTFAAVVLPDPSSHGITGHTSSASGLD
jgi:hypothetical protein